MAEATTVRSTIRLSRELDERLSKFCERTGAVKNRVLALALRSWLDDGGAPALPVHVPDEEPAAGDAVTPTVGHG